MQRRISARSAETRMKYIPALLVVVILAGCIGGCRAPAPDPIPEPPPRARIVDYSEKHVVIEVRSAGGLTGREKASLARKEAERGCAAYGRVPKFMKVETTPRFRLEKHFACVADAADSSGTANSASVTESGLEPRALVAESSESHVVIHVLNTSDVVQQEEYAHFEALCSCAAYGKLANYMYSIFASCTEDYAHCLQWHYTCRAPSDDPIDEVLQKLSRNCSSSRSANFLAHWG